MTLLAVAKTRAREDEGKLKYNNCQKKAKTVRETGRERAIDIRIGKQGSSFRGQEIENREQVEAEDGTRTTNRTVKTGIDRVSIKRTTKRRVMQITQVEETIKGTQRTNKI